MLNELEELIDVFKAGKERQREENWINLTSEEIELILMALEEFRSERN